MKAVLAVLGAILAVFWSVAPAAATVVTQTHQYVMTYAPDPSDVWALNTVDPNNSPGWRTSIAVDKSTGYAHIAYYTYGGSLMYANWNGAAWNPVEIQANLGGSNPSANSIFMRSSIKLDASGNPRIAYADNTTGTLKYAYKGPGGWSIETADNASGVGWYASLALDTFGNPHISYYDYANGKLKYAVKNGSVWTTETADSTTGVGQWTSLAYGTDNVTQVSYVDEAGHLKYARKQGASWTFQPVDTITSAVRYTSIALDSSNNPRVSYYGTPSVLLYASRAGGTWSTETVDPVGDTGWWSSLALDSSDQPHIAYFYPGIYDPVTHQYSASDLKYASKGPGGWSIQTVDAAGDVGANAALALDANNNPHISYQDNTFFGLKYATTAWPVVKTVAASSIGTVSATVSGNLTSLGSTLSTTLSFQYGLDTTYGSTAAGVPSSGNAVGLYSANLAGLTPGFTYHYRAKADSGTGGYNYGDDKTFTTLTAAPQVTTTAMNPNDVTNNSATAYGNLTSVGTASSVVVWFEYGPNTSYGSSSANLTRTSTGSFNINIPGLNSGVTYHFRARADGGLSGPAFGVDQAFSTKTAPGATTNPPTNRLTTSATLNGSLDSMGTATGAILSFEWGPTSGLGSVVAGVPSSSSSAPVAFSANIALLTPGQQYFYRAKVDGGVSGIGYGNIVSFNALLPPTVVTSGWSPITNNSVTLNGNLTSTGSASSVSLSFEYGLTASYGTPVAGVPASRISPGVFSADVAGLSPGTDYHFRAKADGGTSGVSYGADQILHTGSTSPTVATVGFTSVTNNSALVSGNVSSLGTATSVALTFEYGLTEGYGSTVVAVPSSSPSPTAFAATISGLDPNKTYHFRAKADGGAQGAAFGLDMQFTTKNPPTASTSAATSVQNFTATLNGSLDTLGTSTNSTLSFDWGLSTAYGNTALGTPSWSSTAPRAFTGALSGLTAGQTYHFRAKVDGGASGIAYGSDTVFVTTATAPSVNTLPSISQTGNSAVVSGNLTSMGTAGTVAVSFDYGLTNTYGSSTAPASVTTPGVFNGTINGLTPGTTYHFRAHADGGLSGIALSAVDMTFTTLTPPVLTTGGATGVGTSSATLNGNVIALGLASPPLNASFEYGPTTAYGSSTAVVLMNGTGAFNTNVTGLASGTTYHFRARAEGGTQGMGYGSDVTFATQAVSGGGGFSGGGVGGGAAPGPGVTNLGPYTNSDGLFNLQAIIKSDDGLAQLTINQGVLARTKDNLALTSIKIAPPDAGPAAPSDMRLSSLVYEMTPDGATFNPSVSLKIFYDKSKLSSDTDLGSLKIGVFNSSLSRWDLLDSANNAAESSLTSQITHFSNYAIFSRALAPTTPPTTAPPAPAPASFTVSGLSVTPSSATSGATVTISATASNTGGTAGRLDVQLKINGTVESTRGVDIGPGQSTVVSFTTSKSESGSYQVDVNGQTGSFSVSAAVVTPTTAPPTSTPIEQGNSRINWLVIILIVVGVVVVAGVVYFVMKTRRA